MALLWIVVSCAAAAALVLLTAYVCFRMAFYADRGQQTPEEEYPIPPGEIYEPYRDTMVAWMKEARALPYEKAEITSFDGLKLYARYYECRPGATTELMFHGYRGSGERDLCGGIQRAFSLGRNVLIVDQRTSGCSGGNVITFGIREHRDCLAWVDYAVKRFGPQVKLILTGISMGASTVVMAAGEPLPENVIGILADCGFSSAREIIQKVIRQMKLPVKLLYPFVKLGARLYGRFDLEALTPEQAILRCNVPAVFIHGETDDYVPCDMSRKLYALCPAKKRLLTVPGAGHGLAYLVAPQAYLDALTDFYDE